MRRLSTTSTKNILKTALNQWHKNRGGRMVEYSGWEMPVSYKDSIMESHMFTRNHATVFDVSHMLQLKIIGETRLNFLESLVVGDLKSLPINKGCLSLLTNTSGTILDDTIITPKENYVYMVSNAGCAENVLGHLRYKSERISDITVVNLSETRSLIALQGPDASKILQKHLDVDFNTYIDLSKLMFMESFEGKLFGKDVHISRCGYTGEDGFEISMLHEHAEHITDNLVGDETEVRPAGLAARDSLRLEAGLCLYGNDISVRTTPLEASLVWTIGKNRRDPNYPIKFPGWNPIMEQIETKSFFEKRVGITLDVARAPPQHAGVMKDGRKVGVVTSGTVSPVLKKGIGMAYMENPHHLLKTEGLYIEIRNKKLDVKLSKMPFVPTNYYT